MLSLRLSTGLDRKKFFALSGKRLDDAFPTLKKLVSEGFLSDDGEKVAFTTKGFFVSNYILSDLMP